MVKPVAGRLSFTISLLIASECIFQRTLLSPISLRDLSWLGTARTERGGKGLQRKGVAECLFTLKKAALAFPGKTSFLFIRVFCCGSGTQSLKRTLSIVCSRECLSVLFSKFSLLCVCVCVCVFHVRACVICIRGRRGRKNAAGRCTIFAMGPNFNLAIRGGIRQKGRMTAKMHFALALLVVVFDLAAVQLAAANSVTPKITWAQRSDLLFLKFVVSEPREVVLSVNDTHIAFRCMAPGRGSSPGQQDEEYHAVVGLYRKIEAQLSKYEELRSGVQVRLAEYTIVAF